jgi:predicted lysophospholipase L1 biosynthesis ABC-type transport system permease subunit
LADGAIGLVLAVLAVVIGVETLINAHAAIMAMLKVLGTTDAAKATVLTMVRFFIIGHPKITNVAMVVTKLDITIYAIVTVKRENQMN